MKFTIRFAEKKVLVWHGILCKKETLENELDKPTVQKILAGQYKSVHLKKLPGRRIYAARVNSADRLLFTYIERNGQSYLVILDRIYNHDYHKSPYLQDKVLNNYIDNDLPEVVKKLDKVTEEDFEDLDVSDDGSDPENHSSSATSSTTSSTADRVEYQAVKQYKKTFLQLTDSQQTVINHRLPMFISGVAGSGKTCIAIRRLIDYVNCHPTENHRIAYITKNEYLSNEMAAYWRASTEVQPHNHLVEFLSYEAMAKQQDPSLNAVTFVAYPQFKDWLPKKSTITEIEALYEELRLICTCSDFKEYLTHGTRQCIFDTEDIKRDAYDLYQRYADFCRDNKILDLALHKLNITSRYALIVVDEAQDFSRRQLLALSELAEYEQHCFCFDVNQSITEIISIGPFLQQLLSSKEKTQPTHCHLLESHRSPKLVNQPAMTIAKIKNYVLKGALPYTYVEMSVSSSSKLGAVNWMDLPVTTMKIPKRLADLLESPQCAVIVSNDDQKTKASALLSTPLIFTVAEIKGLEYRYIILYNLCIDSRYREISSLLPNNLNDYTPATNRPKSRDAKTNDHFAPALSQLFTAVTRTEEEVWIFEEPRSDLRKLHGLMKKSIVTDEPVSKPEPVAKATDEQWQQQADILAQNNKIEQATKIRKKYQKATKPANPTQTMITENKTQPLMQGTARLAQTQTQAQNYVAGFIKNFNELNFVKLLEHKNFHTLFFLTKGLDHLSLFQWLATEISKESNTFIINKILSKNTLYQKIVDECTIEYLCQEIELPFRQHTDISAFDAYCHSENGKKFLAMLFERNSTVAKGISPKHLYKLDIPLRKEFSPFCVLCKSENGLIVLDKLFEHSDRTIVEDLRYSDLFYAEFYTLSQFGLGNSILLHYLVMCPTLLNGIKSKMLFADHKGRTAFGNLVCHISGINAVASIFNKNHNLTKEIGAGLFAIQPTPVKDENSSEFATLTTTSEGCKLLMLLFTDNPKLCKLLKVSDLFTKLNSLDGALDQMHSAFDYIVTYDNQHELLYFILEKRPDFIEHINSQILFSGNYTDVENLPAIFKLSSNETGISIIQNIFNAKPELIHQVPASVLFTYLSKNDIHLIKESLSRHQECNCESCNKKTQSKLAQYDNLVNFSCFHILLHADSGLGILITLFKARPELCQLITVDFLSLPNQSGNSLLILCFTELGRQLLKLIVSVNVDLRCAELEVEVTKEYLLQSKEGTSKQSVKQILIDTNNNELLQLLQSRRSSMQHT